jgi:hypothetical protein
MFSALPNTNFDITALISYSARSLPLGAPPPVVASIPYVSSWVGKPLPVDTADTDVSSELNLINPFDVPLKLQYMVGKVDTAINYASAVGYQHFELPIEYIPARLIQILITDSNGNAIVPQYTNWRQVFHGLHRALITRDCIMPPQSFYRVYLTKLASAFATGQVASSTPQIGLVGHREISTGGAR